MLPAIRCQLDRFGGNETTRTSAIAKSIAVRAASVLLEHDSQGFARHAVFVVAEDVRIDGLLRGGLDPAFDRELITQRGQICSGLYPVTDTIKYESGSSFHVCEGRIPMHLAMKVPARGIVHIFCERVFEQKAVTVQRRVVGGYGRATRNGKSNEH